MAGRGEGAEVAELLSLYSVPSYVRRARRVEDTYRELLARCGRKRKELLEMVRLRVGQLRQMAGRWDALRPHLADDAQLDLLRALHDELEPVLRVGVPITRSPRALRRALEALAGSIERFNRRWQEHLPGVDLCPVNAARDAYNRYYVLERDCALRFSPDTRRKFVPLPQMTQAELAASLPPLPVPRLS
jgi:hypothetical protein